MKALRSLVCAALVLSSSAAISSSDVDDARTLFERNLAAIQRRDKAAYLACYLDSKQLVRVSPEGYYEVALALQGGSYTTLLPIAATAIIATKPESEVPPIEVER